MEQQTTLYNEKKYWSRYNKSQTTEKTLFLRLLKDLCNTVQNKRMGHNIFCICMKAYALKSSRRVIGELELCKRAGYIQKVPHFNTILHYLRRVSITSELQELIKLSSLPLKAVERKFCCDSSGFGLAIVHDRWSQIRQKYSKHHKYLKAHIAFGTLTNIVTACKITEGTAADSPLLPELLDDTAQSFKIDEWSADKGYLSRENYEAIFNQGALPLIPFKSNSHPRKRNCGIWQEMFFFFKNNQKLFLEKYHLRSNAESGFFMIKQRFGDLTNMRLDVSAKNDVLVKILCHNLCVLCQEIFLLGIEFNFAQLSKGFAQVQN